MKIKNIIFYSVCILIALHISIIGLNHVNIPQNDQMQVDKQVTTVSDENVKISPKVASSIMDLNDGGDGSDTRQQRPQEPTIKPLLTKTGQIYKGYVQIKVQQEQTQNIEFQATLISYDQLCSYSKCYYGWINSYQVNSGGANIGYGNKYLKVQPVFEFKTNSQKDFVIVKHPKMDQIFAQIIEVLCQKINPQIAENPPRNKYKFDSQGTKSKNQHLRNIKVLVSATQSTQTQQPQEQVAKPRYAFEDYIQQQQGQALYSPQKTKTPTKTPTHSKKTLKDVFKIDGLIRGDKIARINEQIEVNDLQTQISQLTQCVVLDRNKLIKDRVISYEVRLNSDNQRSSKGQVVPSFVAQVSMSFKLSEITQVATTKIQAVQKILEDIKDEDKFIDFKALQLKRLNMKGTFNDFPQYIDQSPKTTFDDNLIYNNQTHSGINVVEQLQKAQNILIEGNEQEKDFSLQVMSNYTIYNYKKTIFSKIIFGKTFEVHVQVKCQLLALAQDHQVQCVGNMIYDFFGKTKIIPIFGFGKSVSYSWSWEEQFKGEWRSGVLAGLPDPVDCIGITLNFKANYVINVSISSTTGEALNPYNITIEASATTQVQTQSKTSVRVIAIQGGAFMNGTLIKAGTDTTFTLSYHFSKRQVQVEAKWYSWLSTFHYDWGFFYKSWGMDEGWGDQEIIEQWTVNGIAEKWPIVDKSWRIALS